MFLSFLGNSHVGRRKYDLINDLVRQEHTISSSSSASCGVNATSGLRHLHFDADKLLQKLGRTSSSSHPSISSSSSSSSLSDATIHLMIISDCMSMKPLKRRLSIPAQDFVDGLTSDSVFNLSSTICFFAQGEVGSVTIFRQTMNGNQVRLWQIICIFNDSVGRIL